ncbi:putative GPI-anchored protein pfl2 [Penaeus monodon]|uniref:putative GPI-anchored protein pfl2 n=1 Tax=Penaeus monodon TaxID=6687 RepID=UPI0018A793BD|nr:putative GPI-anchored protein pfl2 [Penaeus monodon]
MSSFQSTTSPTDSSVDSSTPASSSTTLPQTLQLTTPPLWNRPPLQVRTQPLQATLHPAHLWSPPVLPLPSSSMDSTTPYVPTTSSHTDSSVDSTTPTSSSTSEETTTSSVDSTTSPSSSTSEITTTSSTFSTSSLDSTTPPTYLTSTTTTEESSSSTDSSSSTGSETSSTYTNPSSGYSSSSSSLDPTISSSSSVDSTTSSFQSTILQLTPAPLWNQLPLQKPLQLTPALLQATPLQLLFGAHHFFYFPKLLYGFNHVPLPIDHLLPPTDSSVDSTTLHHPAPLKTTTSSSTSALPQTLHLNPTSSMESNPLVQLSLTHLPICSLLLESPLLHESPQLPLFMDSTRLLTRLSIETSSSTQLFSSSPSSKLLLEPTTFSHFPQLPLDSSTSSSNHHSPTVPLWSQLTLLSSSTVRNPHSLTSTFSTDSPLTYTHPWIPPFSITSLTPSMNPPPHFYQASPQPPHMDTTLSRAPLHLLLLFQALLGIQPFSRPPLTGFPHWLSNSISSSHTSLFPTLQLLQLLYGINPLQVRHNLFFKLFHIPSIDSHSPTSYLNSTTEDHHLLSLSTLPTHLLNVPHSSLRHSSSISYFGAPSSSNLIPSPRIQPCPFPFHSTTSHTPLESSTSASSSTSEETTTSSIYPSSSTTPTYNTPLGIDHLFNSSTIETTYLLCGFTLHLAPAPVKHFHNYSPLLNLTPSLHTPLITPPLRSFNTSSVCTTTLHFCHSFIPTLLNLPHLNYPTEHPAPFDSPVSFHRLKLFNTLTLLQDSSPLLLETHHF